MDNNIFITLIRVGIPFSFVAYLFWMQHKEKMAKIEKGIVEPHPMTNGKGALRWAILLTFIGIAISISLYSLGSVNYMAYPLNLGPWMLFGLVPTFAGIALFVIHYVTKDKTIDE